jgi:type IV pilus assembly protein PilA
MKNQKRQAGFTLIELMIVIAIIGILMAYAIPAYRDYTVRSNRGECNAISDGMKTPMAEYFYKWGAWPAAMANIEITGSTAGAHVTGVTTAAGVVVCTVDQAAGAGTVTWTANYAAGDLAVRWGCVDTLNTGSTIAQQVCPN